jgi:hypothetical protein
LILNTKSENLKKHLSALSIVLVLVVVIWTDFNTGAWKNPKRIIQSDVIEYYGYLPAAFIYHDLTLHFRDNYSGSHHFEIWARKLPNGNSVFKYTMGPAMLYAPFFFVANVLASPLGYDAGGYSPPYRLAIVIAALFYLFIGLFFLRKVLTRFFPVGIVAAVLLSLGLGTNLFWYSTMEPGMPHVYDFALVSLLIYLTLSWHNRLTKSKSIGIGLVLGMLTLIRPINVLFVLFFVLYGVKKGRDLHVRLRYFRHHFGHVILVMTTGFLVLIPQLIYWKLITGIWIYYSYGNEGFFFWQPHLMDVLFSFRKGWYIYTPVMLIATLGLIPLFKRKKAFFWSVTMLLVVYLYVVSSWWSWWYGGSLGQRALIELYPLMAFPLAVFYRQASRQPTLAKSLLYILFGSAVLLGGFYSVQYYYGAIHWDSMTKKAYFDSFGRTHPTTDFQGYLQTPDYNNALLGKPEKLKPLKQKETLEQVIDRIKSDPKWFQLIQEKAKKRNIPVDSMLLMDARYVLQQED